MREKLVLPILFSVIFISAISLASAATLSSITFSPSSNTTCSATGTIFYSSVNNQFMSCAASTGSANLILTGTGGGSNGSFSTLAVTGTSTFATGGGRVGIGTATPATNLDVNGNIQSSIYYDRDNTNYYIDAAGNTMPYSALFAGSVGIGTTTPATKLVLSSGSETDMDIVSTASGGTDWRIVTNPSWATSSLVFFRYGGGGTLMALGWGGNVGIGAANPTTAGLVVATNVSGAAVDVNNNRIINVGTPISAADAATKSYVDSAITTGVSGGVNGTANYIAKFTGANTVGNSVIYQSGSNVGIGTTGPGLALEIKGSNGLPATTGTNGNGNLRLRSVAGTNVAVLDIGSYSSTGAGWLQASYDNDASTHFPLLLNPNGGNVGIGTSTPGTNLDVNGNINVGYILYDKSNSNYYVNPSANIMPHSAVFASDAVLPALQANYGYSSPEAFSGDNKHRQIFYEVETAGNNPAHYVKIASIQFTNAAQYAGASVSGNLQTGSSYRGGKMGQFSLNCATGPNSNASCNMYETGDMSAVGTLFALDYPNANGSYLDRIDLYVTGGWYSSYFGTLDVYSGQYTTVSVWQAGSDVGTSTPAGGTTVTDNDAYSIMSPNVGINTTQNAWTMYVNGSSTVTGNWSLGGAAQADLNMGGKSISGVNKLTVTTLDPIYKIGGVNYATYGPDIIGLKTEVFGKISLPSATGAREVVIDFGNAEKGSDLWLFWQTINEGKDMKDISVYLTPNFDGQTWYNLDPAKKQIIIFGLPNQISGGRDSSGAPTSGLEVSYHLVAPRYDSAKWTNFLSGDEQGTALPVK